MLLDCSKFLERGKKSRNLAYLESLHAAVGKGVFQPFRELEAFVRQVAVKRQCDAEHSSDERQRHA